MTETEKLLTEIHGKLARLEELAEQSDGKISALFEYRDKDRSDLDEVRVEYVPRETFSGEIKDIRSIQAVHATQLADVRATLQKYAGMGIGAAVLIQILGQFIGSIE